MLQMINDDRIWTPEEIEKKYKDCKYILYDFKNLQDIKGKLYCVSESNESFRDICRINYNMAKKGINSILLGSYNNGGAVGVQYEVK